MDDDDRAWEARVEAREARVQTFIVQATVLVTAAILFTGLGLLDARRIGVVAVAVAITVVPFAWLREAEARIACVEAAECFVPVLPVVAAVELRFLPPDLFGLEHAVLAGGLPAIAWGVAGVVGYLRAKA